MSRSPSASRRRGPALLVGGLLGAVVALTPLTALTPAAQAAGSLTDLRINEVESNGGTPVDWIELVNPTDTALDLSGLRLKDSDDTRTFAIAAGTTIPAGGYVAIDVDVAGGFGLGAADSARLFAADGATLIDSYSWTAHASGSYGRCPDATGAFVEMTSSKGAANTCPVVVPAGVRFNEVESNADPVGDFAELINTGTTPVDLSGYRFRDNDPTHTQYALPAGTVIAPGGYLVLAEAAFGFGLGANDSVTLWLPDGTTVVDTYAWTAHAATSWGRCPNGTGDFRATGASTRGAANDCTGLVRLNEVESDGGTPGDWIELVNTASTSQDISGWTVKDSGDAGSYTLPAGTTLAPGAFLVLDQGSTFTAGLGSADSARLFDAAGVLADSYSWTAHATTTYGRCPDPTGAFATTSQSTKGAANLCPGQLTTVAWPGGTAVSTVDPQNTFASNLSGLSYVPTGTTAPGTLWAVRNGPGALFRLARTGTTWAPTTGWETGRALTYTDGTGDVDAEGVVAVGGAIYVASERNNAANTVSRPAVLRYDPSGTGPLTAQVEWNLTGDLPGLGANLGLEAITYLPDAWVTARGLRDVTTGAAYDPTRYPAHGGGVFLVGVEQTGQVIAYVLPADGSAPTRIASFASGFVSVMELTWDPEREQLWVACDDTCNGRIGRFTITDGAFTSVDYLERPAGMPNINNEGFALAGQAECVGGVKPVLWADDSSTGGYALREGTVACTPLPDTTAPTVTITSGPAEGATVAAAPTFGFASADADLDRIECRLDQGAFAPCTSPFTVPATTPNGPHTLALRGVDATGNVATPLVRAFTLAKPVGSVSLSGGPAEGARVATVPTYTLATDEVAPARFECRIDDGAYAVCTSPVSLPAGLADGPHTLRVRVVDTAGNLGEPTARSIVLDRGVAAPVLTGPADGATVRRVPQYAVTSTEDDVARFECAVDAGAFTACVSPVVPEAAAGGDLAQGRHTLRVRAVDTTGNVSVETTRSFVLDSRPPVVRITAGPAAGATVRRAPVFRFTATPAADVARFECRIDAAAWRTCRGPVTGAGGRGGHRFAVRAVDAVGNVSAPVERRYRVVR
ncbi:lamin tail domain-containing protein [Nocardioides sp.]|uniref:lamin tail domain-containing protein n=1 Tax=Nocardioides sp. TaxID=35761 RepID=UPI00351121F3